MDPKAEQTAEMLREQKAREAYFTASQRQLVWARFKKQRSAMTAATIFDRPDHLWPAGTVSVTL